MNTRNACKKMAVALLLCALLMAIVVPLSAYAERPPRLPAVVPPSLILYCQAQITVPPCGFLQIGVPYTVVAQTATMQQIMVTQGGLTVRLWIIIPTKTVPTKPAP